MKFACALKPEGDKECPTVEPVYQPETPAEAAPAIPETTSPTGPKKSPTNATASSNVEIPKRTPPRASPFCIASIIAYELIPSDKASAAIPTTGANPETLVDNLDPVFTASTELNTLSALFSAVVAASIPLAASAALFVAVTNSAAASAASFVVFSNASLAATLTALPFLVYFADAHFNSANSLALFASANLVVVLVNASVASADTSTAVLYAFTSFACFTTALFNTYFNGSFFGASATLRARLFAKTLGLNLPLKKAAPSSALDHLSMPVLSKPNHLVGLFTSPDDKNTPAPAPKKPPMFP